MFGGGIVEGNVISSRSLGAAAGPCIPLLASRTRACRIPAGRVRRGRDRRAFQVVRPAAMDAAANPVLAPMAFEPQHLHEKLASHDVYGGASMPPDETDTTTVPSPAPLLDAPARRRVQLAFAAILASVAIVVAVSNTVGMSFTLKVIYLCALAAAVGGVVFGLVPPIRQPLEYHLFADARTLCCGVPNTFDVISNVPFLLFGVCGFIVAAMPSAVAAATSPSTPGFFSPVVFLDAAEQWCWIVFFVGCMLTAAGSGYYHWRPDNARLVWDRYPMTICFMEIWTQMLQERLEIGATGGACMQVVFLALGLFSVFWWSRTDDLRLYFIVQFFPLACVPLLYVIFPARFHNEFHLLVAFAWYMAAKVTEVNDKRIFELTGQRVSGHSIKHVLASVGMFWCVLIAALVVTILAAVAAIAYANSFWLRAPTLAFDIASLRLLGLSLALQPPTWNTDCAFNLTLTNRIGIGAQLVQASAHMFYVDGAQQQAGVENPDAYFLASAALAAAPVYLPAYDSATLSIRARAVNSFVTDTRVLSLAVRDCALAPAGAGMWLRFKITGVLQVWRFPAFMVPAFHVDVRAASPPCIV